VRPPGGLALSAIAVRLSCAAQILSTLAPPAQQHMRVGVLVLSLRDTRTQPPPTLLVPLDAGLASHVLPASRSPPSQIQRSSRHVLPPSQIHGARPVGAHAQSRERCVPSGSARAPKVGEASADRLRGVLRRVWRPRWHSRRSAARHRPWCSARRPRPVSRPPRASAGRAARRPPRTRPRR